MRLDALWATIRGQPQPPDDDSSRPSKRPRIGPCTLEELDARLDALDKFIHERDADKAPPKLVRSPPVDRKEQQAKQNEDNLRTWFVLKSLDDASSKDARDQQPPQPPARPESKPQP